MRTARVLTRLILLAGHLALALSMTACKKNQQPQTQVDCSRNTPPEQAPGAPSVIGIDPNGRLVMNAKAFFIDQDEGNGNGLGIRSITAQKFPDPVTGAVTVRLTARDACGSFTIDGIPTVAVSGPAPSAAEQLAQPRELRDGESGGSEVRVAAGGGWTGGDTQPFIVYSTGSGTAGNGGYPVSTHFR